MTTALECLYTTLGQNNTYLTDGVRVGQEKSEYAGGSGKENGHTASLQLLDRHSRQQSTSISDLQSDSRMSQTAVQGHLQQEQRVTTTFPNIGNNESVPALYVNLSWCNLASFPGHPPPPLHTMLAYNL